MRTTFLISGAILLLALHAFADASIANGTMDGAPADHSDGKGFLVTPPSWTPVNTDATRGDRISVENSDRADAGPCLHIKTFGGDAGVYQSVHPLDQGKTYLLSAWVKRLSGSLAIEAYSYAWGPAIMRYVDSTSTNWQHVVVPLSPIDDGAHIYLVAAATTADFLIDDLDLRPAPVQVGDPELLPYDLGPTKPYRVRLSTQPDAAASFNVLAQAVDNSTGQIYSAPVKCSVATAKPAVVNVAIPVDAEGTFTLRVTDAVSGDVLGGSHDIHLNGSPWDVHFPYKNSLYSSLGYKWPMRINLQGGASDVLRTLTGTVTLTDSGGRTVRSVDASRTATGLLVRLDAHDLPTGDYRLGLTVRTTKNRVVRADTRPLRILPAADNEVVINPSGDTMVNGRRFFPIGLYWVLANPSGWLPGPDRKTDDLNELRQAGFNTLHTYAFEHDNDADTDDNALAYLDMAHDLGFMVMMGLKRDWYQGNTLDLQAITRRVERLRNHPALLCWTLWDEPNFAEGVQPRVQSLYDTVNAADPYHPTMPVFGGASGRPFHDAADANLFDCYPGAGGAGTLPQVFQWAHASMPDKPIWYVAQAYKQGDHLPSVEDMRLFYQYALDAGSKAIFWYSYGGDGKDWDSIRITPEHFANVKRVVRELADKVH